MNVLLRALPLVFASGFCALVYQVAWMRLFRLSFGASTAASAAVVAIFMAGLGAGSLLFGRRSDRSPSALRLYGHLEIGVGLSAAFTPFLVGLVGAAYLGLGGTATLGAVGGNALRLVLAALVIAVPTFLMGGSLPAIVAAVSEAPDAGRRRLGTVYAINTLGAVAGAFVVTFFMIELFGVRQSIWLACLLNVAAGLLARVLARRQAAAAAPVAGESGAASEELEDVGEPEETGGRRAPLPFVLFAAAAVGFAFFAMELVWYRLLAPLLGGSSYSFGLILAIALLGIGLGGLIYGARPSAVRPSLLGLATTCALEALFLVIPLAAGDQLAVLTTMSRTLGAYGFWGVVASWLVVTTLVVLVPATIAGYQFPLLVGLLGAGRDRVGWQVGMTYIANTFGAMAGAIGSGFGLMTLLGAVGLWRAIIVLLVALSAACVLLHSRGALPRLRPALLPACAALLTVLLVFSRGPTAAWRNSAIGAGRAPVTFDGPNALRRWMHQHRTFQLWSADGRESAVAAESGIGVTLIVNGKSDGNVLGDASTMVMAPLLGAALHPEPKHGLVIGLGLGMSAGWLAEVPSIERVDVAELEPAVDRVAELCDPLAFGVMSHPKVHVTHADGREFLLTSRETFDVVMSEPSNPYRAGVGSLFSQDFYRKVSDRLDDSGVFVQWVQLYDVNADTVRTVVATLASVFPSVELWSLSPADLALVARKSSTPHDLSRLRQSLAAHPYDTALSWTWGVSGIEGFYSGYIASDQLSRAILADAGNWVDTDDKPVVEFGFARFLGRGYVLSSDAILAVARRQGHDRPRVTGPLGWPAVEDARQARDVVLFDRLQPGAAIPDSDPWRARQLARRAFEEGRAQVSVDLWQRTGFAHRSDALTAARAAARLGRSDLAAVLERWSRADANAARALAHGQRGDWSAAGQATLATVAALREQPRHHFELVHDAFRQVPEITRNAPEEAAALFEALAEPLPARVLDEARLRARVNLALAAGYEARCAEAFAPFEPDVPWERDFLAARRNCYAASGSGLLGRAERELDEYLSHEPPELVVDAPPTAPLAPG